MADVIDEARRLKAEAMDARDLKHYDRAGKLLRQAEHGLHATLEELRERRMATEDAPGRREVAVANQLIHILGSIGGTLRREGRHEEAARAYDAGHELEVPAAGYGIVNSYNLVQRLVSRVFLDPRAFAEGTPVAGLDVHEELERAREDVEGQIVSARRGDEYAVADLLTVMLLLGDPGWRSVLRRFLIANPAQYAVDVTRDTLEELSERTDGDLRARLLEAIERLEADAA